MDMWLIADIALGAVILVLLLTLPAVIKRRKSMKSIFPVFLLAGFVFDTMTILFIAEVAVAVILMIVIIILLVTRKGKKVEESKEVTDANIDIGKEIIDNKKKKTVKKGDEPVYETRVPAGAVQMTEDGKIFLLTREDVFERVDKTAINMTEHAIKASYIERTGALNSDSFFCGKWLYTLMFERQEVIILYCRLPEATVDKLSFRHPTIKNIEYGGFKDWYKVIVDGTYKSKKEVYDILDKSFNYVLGLHYVYDVKTNTYSTDEAAAKVAATHAEEIEVLVKKESVKDEDISKAIQAHTHAAQVRMDSKTFVLGKVSIAKAIRDIAGKGCEIKERPVVTATSLPLPDTYYSTYALTKYRDKKPLCYAYVYESLETKAVRVIVKVGEDTVEKCEEKYPSFARSKFPNGSNWYVFTVDGTFKSEKEIFALIETAREFVNGNKDKENAGKY